MYQPARNSACSTVSTHWYPKDERQSTAELFSSCRLLWRTQVQFCWTKRDWCVWRLLVTCSFLVIHIQSWSMNLSGSVQLRSILLLVGTLGSVDERRVSISDGTSSSVSGWFPQIPGSDLCEFWCTDKREIVFLWTTSPPGISAHVYRSERCRYASLSFRPTMTVASRNTVLENRKKHIWIGMSKNICSACSYRMFSEFLTIMN